MLEVKRNILLLGGTGFLGSHLIFCLLEKGYGVTVIGRSKRGKKLSDRIDELILWFNPRPDLLKNLTLIEGNVESERFGLSHVEYDNLCKSIDEILHCLSNTSFSESKRDIVYRSNVDTLKPILEFATNSSCKRFHYVSTAYAAGKAEGICYEQPITQCNFNNVYEESKAKAESIITNFFQWKPTHLNIIRPSIIYGNSVTGRSNKFNALYYPVRSLKHIRDIYLNDFHVKLVLTKRGAVNVVPIDHFLKAMLDILEKSNGDGIYHIINHTPPNMETLVAYTSRFLEVNGFEVSYDITSADSNPAEELFQMYMDPYKPYISDTRTFDDTNMSCLTGNTCPQLTWEVFKRCLDYAVEVEWGKKLY